MLVALVLLAALLHASWNALGKASDDKLVGLAMITVSGGCAIGLLIPFVPLPAPAAWPFVLGSLVLHFAYQLTLITAYRHGDLSHVYPIARGVAPLGVAVVGALFLGEAPDGGQLVGLILASLAIASLAFGGTGTMSARALRSALLTGFWISCYVVVDGAGARASGHAVGFAAWLLLLDAIPIGVFAWIRRRGRLVAALRREGWRPVAGGVVSVISYGIVLWAFAREALWGVTALRETSVVFAALIGARLLREPFGRRRMVAAAVLAIGLVALRL